MNSRWFVGLASASSAEAVNAALVELDGVGLDARPRRLVALRYPYGDELATLLRRVGQPGTSDGVPLLAQLHRALGETFAAAALAVADRALVDLPDVQCIACPGHGVWNDPEGRLQTTLAIGMPAVVAERLGVTVLGDLATRDVAAGGQAAPLAALADHVLLRHPDEGRLLVHLGGVGTVVYLPAGGGPEDVVGWDAGPCNALLDGLMRHLTGGRERYDPGGRHAVQGKCHDALLADWLAHPFLQRRPPRAVPRHRLGDDLVAEVVRQGRDLALPLRDVLCTATHLVVRCVADSVRRWLPEVRPARVLLSGGGVRNGLLWQLLGQRFPEVPLERTDAHGVPADARAAAGLAVLAALFLDGVPGNAPAATGAAGTRLLGSLTPGAPSHWARALAWMAARAAPLGVERDDDGEW